MPRPQFTPCIFISVSTTSGHCGRNTGGQRLSLRQLIAAAMAAVSADAEPRPRACLSMSGWDWLNTIGHAAGVEGSGVHRPLFQWVLSHSILQNESRGYPITLESSLGLLHCCAMCPDRRSEDSIRLSLSSIRTSINTENHITEKMNHREIAVLAPVMSDNLGDIAQSHVANLIRRARANP